MNDEQDILDDEQKNILANDENDDDDNYVFHSPMTPIKDQQAKPQRILKDTKHRPYPPGAYESPDKDYYSDVNEDTAHKDKQAMSIDNSPASNKGAKSVVKADENAAKDSDTAKNQDSNNDNKAVANDKNQDDANDENQDAEDKDTEDEDAEDEAVPRRIPYDLRSRRKAVLTQDELAGKAGNPNKRKKK